MMRLTLLWSRLWLDQRGTAVIETAFVLPILCMLSLGAFEVSMLVARNSELRSALAEAEAIALAHAPQDQAQLDVIEHVMEASTGLADEQVVLARRYRCGTDAALMESEGGCSDGAMVSHYLELTLSDSYTPRWVSFGIGAPVSFTVTRTVQIG